MLLYLHYAKSRHTRIKLKTVYASVTIGTVLRDGFQSLVLTPFHPPPIIEFQKMPLLSRVVDVVSNAALFGACTTDQCLCGNFVSL